MDASLFVSSSATIRFEFDRPLPLVSTDDFAPRVRYLALLHARKEQGGGDSGKVHFAGRCRQNGFSTSLRRPAWRRTRGRCLLHSFTRRYLTATARNRHQDTCANNGTNIFVGGPDQIHQVPKPMDARGGCIYHIRGATGNPTMVHLGVREQATQEPGDEPRATPARARAGSAQWTEGQMRLADADPRISGQSVATGPWSQAGVGEAGGGEGRSSWDRSRTKGQIRR